MKNYLDLRKFLRKDKTISLKESEEYFQGVVPYSKEGEYFKEQEHYLLEQLSNDFNTPSAMARLLIYLEG